MPQKLDVICISETQTNITNLKLINLHGYNFYYNNSLTRADGSGIYMSKSLPSKELIEPRMNIPVLDCEVAWVEISTGKIDAVVIVSIYRHPKQSMEKFIEMLETRLYAINMSKKLTFLGDFNLRRLL